MLNRKRCIFTLVLCLTLFLGVHAQAAGNYRVTDYGAKGDGVADDTAAFKAAITAASIAGGIVLITGGNFLITSTLTVAANGVHIKGQGTWASMITFAPVGDSTLFKFSARAGMLYYSSLKDLSLSGLNKHAKTYLDLVDVDLFHLESVSVYDRSSSGSIALQIRGRDHIRIEKFTANCDKPIMIVKNPNNNIDLDGARFQDIYLVCNIATGNNVEIGTGLNLTNVYFEPPFHCNWGQNGIYWKDTTSSNPSLNISIRGLRHEQPKAHGYAVYLDHNTGIYNLLLDGVYSGVSHGYYLRKVQGEMRSCLYLGIETDGSPYKGTALNLDNLAGDLLCTSFSNANGTLSIGPGAKKVLGLSRSLNSTGYDSRTLEIYSPITDLDVRSVTTHNGVRSWCWRGKVAAGTSTKLMPLIGSNLNSCNIMISGRNTNHGQAGLEGGTAIAGAGSHALLNGTANFAISDTPGKLCVLLTTTPFSIKNNLSYDVDVVLTANWVDATKDME